VSLDLDVVSKEHRKSDLPFTIGVVVELVTVDALLVDAEVLLLLLLVLVRVELEVVFVDSGVETKLLDVVVDVGLLLLVTGGIDVMLASKPRKRSGVL
jgi:hypothetical protein